VCVLSNLVVWYARVLEIKRKRNMGKFKRVGEDGSDKESERTSRRV
jgi:hypothetical protein